jgi:hypothetical protein
MSNSSPLSANRLWVQVSPAMPRREPPTQHFGIGPVAKVQPKVMNSGAQTPKLRDEQRLLRDEIN